MSLAIRPATRDDAPALLPLLHQLTGTPLAIGGVLASLEDAMAHPVLLAVDGARVLGLVAVTWTRMLHRPAPDARITALVVDDAARGQGIGRRLVAAAEAVARRQGCGRIELTSNRRRTEAHGFYRALGFVDTSLRFSRELDA